MGLVARELESRGIATVCLVLLREVAEKVKPPRALAVPFGWGQPLGPPARPELHRRVALEALRMLEASGEGPELADFHVAPGGDGG